MVTALISVGGVLLGEIEIVFYSDGGWCGDALPAME